MSAYLRIYLPIYLVRVAATELGRKRVRTTHIAL